MESACKRRKLDNSAQSAASHASESMTDRPPGVKSAKANGKKGKAEERLSEYTGMWSIRQEDMANKKELTKMKLLDRLIAKVPLSREVKEWSLSCSSHGLVVTEVKEWSLSCSSHGLVVTGVKEWSHGSHGSEGVESVL
ncbi:hypothetical protein YC2023_022389 [Brassica napus]